MPRKPIKFNLDFMRKDIFSRFTVKQFDDVTLTITPLLNNEPYNVSNMTCKIYVGVNNEMYKQDTNITVSSNSIVVTLDKNMLANDGRAYAEIELTDSQGTVTSSSFIFDIDRKIGEGATIPGAIEGFVEKYKKLTEEFKKKFQDCLNNVDDRFNILTSQQQQDSEVILARKGEVSLKAKIDKIDEQFNTNAKEKNFQTKDKKAICSIIFDDGWMWDYTMVLPYFKSIGIVGNTAMFSNALAGTNYLQRSQLKALEDEGWSILSHTAGHIDCGTSTEGQMRADFEKSIRDIKACGVKRCDYLVYPFNHYSITALNVVREYFKGAFAKSRPMNDAENEFNTTPLNQYAMYRIHAETPLSEIKELLDKAIANNGYIVLMAHSHYYGNTTQFPDHAERFARLKENIKYLMDNGVEILGVNEAMDRIGNIVTIGDNEISRRYYFQSKDGSIASSDITENIQNGIGITVDTPITLYPRNKVTTHSFMDTSSSNFPISDAGILITYRPTNGYANDELSFQIWYPNNEQDRYFKRIWLSSEKRWFIWHEFRSETYKKKVQLKQNSLTLQHQYTMNYNVEGLTTNSYISLFPSVELPDDVIIQPSIVQDGVLKVKIYNLTSNNIQLPSIKYNLIYQ